MNYQFDSSSFSKPSKCIFNTQSTNDFQTSLAIYRLQIYLQKYITIVKGCTVISTTNNDIVNSFICLLKRLYDWIDEIPPIPSSRRYGNFACRDWHDKLMKEMNQIWVDFLPQKFHSSIIELSHYLGNAFGSKERLDYGTGHELSFLAVIICLDMLGIWDEMSGENFLCIWFHYYELVHKLILTYTLEPAGSHGVWGLDDHFHLSYVFGASQWSDEASYVPINPKQITDKKIVMKYREVNLYCHSVFFIFQVKSGPLSQHSPMLFDISRSVISWPKVEKGLIKMYKVEVLSKFPVVQHFWFGTGFFPWINMSTGKPLRVHEPIMNDNESQLHNPQSRSSRYIPFDNHSSTHINEQTRFMRSAIPPRKESKILRKHM